MNGLVFSCVVSVPTSDCLPYAALFTHPALVLVGLQCIAGVHCWNALLCNATMDTEQYVQITCEA